MEVVVAVVVVEDRGGGYSEGASSVGRWRSGWKLALARSKAQSRGLGDIRECYEQCV